MRKWRLNLHPLLSSGLSHINISSFSVGVSPNHDAMAGEEQAALPAKHTQASDGGCRGTVAS